MNALVSTVESDASGLKKISKAPRQLNLQALIAFSS